MPIAPLTGTPGSPTDPTAPLVPPAEPTARLTAAPAPTSAMPLAGPGAGLSHGDTLVLDYLAELWAASDDLPPDLRDELMRTVTDYVAARREPGADPGPVLSRLGPPAQLAAATRRGYLPVHLRLPAPAPAPPPEPRVAVVGGGAESAALALLIGGTFLMPVVSPAAGMLIATGSSRWTPAQKAAGWVLTAGSAAAAFLAVLVLAGLDVPAGPVLIFGYLAACAGSVVAGLALLAGMRARA
ncbi:HAAS signaling domain-containing protein [Actinoplanes sp. NPDC020271]|uniref:HAAS signaling domain-containing protein n=1 Tax=Actinoplanes sp. NPDC020271 TaxID=3363896 RepID=UPI0037B635D2